MFDIGWVEMAIIAVVALIIIGPKDLPKAMRTVSHWVGKARSLAREFQSGLDDIVRDTELQDMRKEIEQATDIDLPGTIDGDLDLPSVEDMTGDTGDYLDGIAKPKAKSAARKKAPAKTAKKTASSRKPGGAKSAQANNRGRSKAASGKPSTRSNATAKPTSKARVKPAAKKSTAKPASKPGPKPAAKPSRAKTDA